MWNRKIGKYINFLKYLLALIHIVGFNNYKNILKKKNHLLEIFNSPAILNYKA